MSTNSMCAVLLVVLLQLGELSAELSRIKVRQDGHFVDNQGRVRIFHGFNAVNKQFPWYPQQMSNLSLVKHYKEWGFNAVRLGTMWSGVEPEQGKYNETYLQVIRSQLSNLADNGMYAFLGLLNGRTSVRCGSAADPLGSARTSGGPLADPPGVLFARTPADLLRTPKESAADSKIRGGFAADPPQVRGGAVDFLVSKKTEKVRQSAK